MSTQLYYVLGGYYFDSHAEQPVPAPHNRDNYANFIGFAFKAGLSDHILVQGDGRKRTNGVFAFPLLKKKKKGYKNHLHLVVFLTLLFGTALSVTLYYFRAQPKGELTMIRTLEHCYSANDESNWCH